MAQWQPKPKIIQQKAPNQPIFLYRGLIEATDKTNSIKGTGFVEISWHPFPHITVEFTYYGEKFEDNEKLNFGNIELDLIKLKSQFPIKVYLSRLLSHGTGKREYFGYLKEPFKQGVTENLSSITFHLPNFLWFNTSNDFGFEYDDEGNEIEIEREGWLMFDGQIIFDYDDWHIVLANLDNAFEMQESLEAQGGYGFINICKAERLDGKAFSLNQGYEIIDAFTYYLSFVRGMWIAPLLVSGFDANGNPVLEEWRTPTIKADSWQSSNLAWTDEESTSFVYAFPGFMKKWQDEAWHGVIKNSIQWYVESYKHTNGYNTSIILVHSALEKLAWTYLNTNNYVSSEGFKKLPSDDKFRLLFKALDISPLPMDENWEITKLAKQDNWLDSVNAIMHVRNSIIHPSISRKEQNMKLTETMMQEAFTIAHDCLLKCLLKLFEYPYSID